MSSRSTQKKRRRAARLTRRQQAACLDLTVRLAQASDCFEIKASPLWQRTIDGMRILDDLPFEDLPPMIQRAIAKADEAIDTILRRYDLEGQPDYQLLTEVDLLRIQNLNLKVIGP